MDSTTTKRRLRVILTVIGLVVVVVGLYAATLMRFGEMMAGGR